MANTKVAPLVSSPPHGELQSRQNSRDVRRTHCVRKAGRETTLHFISELCLSDFTVGDVEAATFENWALQWELSHILSIEASAFSNMKYKCVLKCSPFEKLGWRKIKMFTLPPAAPMIMLSTGRGRHIFLASRPTPRQPAQNHQPPRKYHFYGLERTKSQGNQSFKWAFWGATYVWAAEPD